MRGLRYRIAIIAALMVMSPIVVHGQVLSATWDPNPPADQVTNYEVCIGTTSLSCNFRQATLPATDLTYQFAPNAGVLYRVTVRAISAAGTGNYAPEVVTSIPALTQPGNQTSTVNVPISPLSLSASDPDGGVLQFSHTGLPFGLTLNQSTGVITGTPTTLGTFNVTVFVFDGLVTVSRSFVWTVQAAGSDVIAPALTITSHANNQTVNTSSITLAGTATDSGAGGSGVTSVTVNGTAATGGTATGNNTANWSRTVTLLAGANLITVVAVDGANNARTSQITINYSAASQATVTAGAVSPASGTGATQTFSAQYTDTAGVQDLQYVYLKFAVAPTGATNTCMVRYDRAAQRLSLRDNAGTWMPGATTGTQQNSQCSLSISGSSTSVSGQTLTLSVAMTFDPSYAGVKNIYSYASTMGGATTDWQQRGSWTVPSFVSSALTAGAVTPNSGSGFTQTFSAQYTNPFGVSDIAFVYLKFHTAAIGPTNTCMVRYEPATGRLSLRDSAGVWLEGAIIPGSGTQQNPQCSINLAGSSASAGGQMLTLNVAVSFRPSYAGVKNIYSYASTVGGIITDWQQRGSWTVPSAATLTADSVTPNAGSGSTATLAAQFTDTLGVSDIGYVYVKVASTSAGPANTCMVRYDRAAGLLSLRDDAGVWQTGRSFSQGGTQTNSQCTINFSSSSATVSGLSLTLTVSITFRPAYAGARNVYLYGSTVGGTVTDWQQRGTWTVQ
jgi:hypothetical protein